MHPNNATYRTQPRGLKTWESTGSLVSNPAPMFEGAPSNEHIKTVRSFSHPRVGQRSANFPNQPLAPYTDHNQNNQFNKLFMIPQQNRQPLPMVPQQNRQPLPMVPQQNGQPLSMVPHQNGQLTKGNYNHFHKMNRRRTHTDPFLHPFFQPHGQEASPYDNDQSFFAENANPNFVQENFQWQSEGNQPESAGMVETHPQFDNNTEYYPGHRQPVYQGQTHKPPFKPTKIPTNELNQKLVPFTKKTGKESQEQFLKLMKPGNTVERRDLGRVTSLPPHANRVEERQRVRPSRQEVIVDHVIPDDSSVKYTEVVPHLLNRQGRTAERHGRNMRSRSFSPAIYTEIAPQNIQEKKATQTNNLKPGSQRNTARDLLTLGGDIEPMALREDSRNLKNWRKPHQHLKTMDTESHQSQTPSEYSISLGAPRLELRRLYKTDSNNNIRPLYQRRDNDKTQPFPNSANLEQMILSDSNSSKKSGTIKSVLKQPSEKFPITVS